MKKNIKIFSGITVLALAAVYLAFFFLSEEPTEGGKINARLLKCEEVLLEEIMQKFGEPLETGYDVDGDKIIIMVEYRNNDSSDNPNTGVYLDVEAGRVVNIGYGESGYLKAIVEEGSDSLNSFTRKIQAEWLEDIENNKPFPNGLTDTTEQSLIVGPLP